jgi:hypothetical protein
MYFLSAAAVTALSQKPPLNEALSGLFGSISVTAWICLLVRLFGPSLCGQACGCELAMLTLDAAAPAHCQLQGAKRGWLVNGLSVRLAARRRYEPVRYDLSLSPDPARRPVYIPRAPSCCFCMLRSRFAKWRSGFQGRDAKFHVSRANYVPRRLGALFTSLAPTAVVLASYFCMADLVLISQCVYYNTINARKRTTRQNSVHTEVSEDEPLLNRLRSSSMGLPGSQRHPTYHHTESSLEPLRKIVTGEDDTPDSKPWLHNFLSILAVYLVGATGWFVSYKFGAWDQDPPVVGGPEDAETFQAIGLVLGYVSAVFYLW